MKQKSIDLEQIADLIVKGSVILVGFDAIISASALNRSPLQFIKGVIMLIGGWSILKAMSGSELETLTNLVAQKINSKR